MGGWGGEVPTDKKNQNVGFSFWKKPVPYGPGQGLECLGTLKVSVSGLRPGLAIEVIPRQLAVLGA